MRDPARTDALPTYACDGEGALHVMNRFNQTVDPKWFGGSAIAIAYTSDVNSLQPNDLTVISVNTQSPWFRSTAYPIPAGLPPCPSGGCLCTWNWIHQANHGEGYGKEIYNNLYRCTVTGQTNSKAVLSKPNVPKDCTGNSANCMTGPKTPMYLYQASGNNLPDLDTPPNYNENWGFKNGAQNDIFSSSTQPDYTSPTATALPSGWTGIGCYVDQNARSLPIFQFSSTNNTISSCVSSCAKAGNTYAGVEGNECWCAKSSPVLVSAPSSDCNKPCSGDTWATCGGDWRLNVFKASNAPSASTASPTSTSTTAPTSYPTAKLPSGWSAVGCVVDNANTRTLDSGATTANDQTIAKCIAIAQQKGLPYAGVEYGRECWVGTSASKANIQIGTGCNVPCGGDSGTICGGAYRLSLYVNNNLMSGSATTSKFTSTAASSTNVKSASTSKASASSSPSPSPSSSSSLPSGWKDLGCQADSSTKRILTGYTTNNYATNSAQSCINLCASKGYTYAGTEYGWQCYCGNTANLNPSSGCDTNCPDKSGKCGGAYRMNLYSSSSGSSSGKRDLTRRRLRFANRHGDMGV